MAVREKRRQQNCVEVMRKSPRWTLKEILEKKRRRLSVISHAERNRMDKEVRSGEGKKEGERETKTVWGGGGGRW